MSNQATTGVAPIAGRMHGNNHPRLRNHFKQIQNELATYNQSALGGARYA